MSGQNIALAHLLLEQALLSPNGKAAGRPFVITDPNPTITFGDVYNLLSTIAVTPFKVQLVPSLPLYMISYIVEQYHLLQAKIPTILPALSKDLQILQPGLWSISAAHFIGDDSSARKSIEDGGLGYKGIYTTLEGMCTQIKTWNDEHAGMKEDEKVLDKSLKREAENVGAIGGAVKR